MVPRFLMQGGTNPNLPFSYYTNILREIKKRFDITMHSFSPAEIMKMKDVSGRLIARGSRSPIARSGT